MATMAAPGSTRPPTTIPAHARGGARLARRAGLAGARARSAACRSRCCGSPASTGRARMCSRGSSPGARTASPSRAMCSTASMSPTSRRRSTPPSRAAPTASSTSPTTSPPPIPTRCCWRRSSSASSRRRKCRWRRRARSLTPFALSFYAGCVRVRNDKLKRVLGVRLRYPTYREGLRALFDDGYEARDPLAPSPSVIPAKRGRVTRSGFPSRDDEDAVAALQNSATAAISRSMSSGRDSR